MLSTFRLRSTWPAASRLVVLGYFPRFGDSITGGTCNGRAPAAARLIAPNAVNKQFRSGRRHRAAQYAGVGEGTRLDSEIPRSVILPLFSGF